jgi:hypothetical protein
MTTTNLFVNPYYDDFDPTANYAQILFKPGVSVQARELTQLQTILKDQVAKFGSHIFKHGSVVLPGNSTSELNLCFVKLLVTETSVASLEGKSVLSSISGLRGYIKKGIPATNIDPATLYVSYYNVGTGGEKVFSNSDSLVVDGTIPLTTVASGATGAASMAFINEGVFFINGTFVQVNKQSVVLSNTDVPSCHVLLKITESIVTSDEDSTLLDPAQGSYNYAAPGADRLKITLTLVSLPLDAAITQDYVEIMRYNEGVLEEHLKYPKYSELEKNLARRTFDESGDYVVSGLETSIREHLKSTINNGRYDSPTGDESKMLYTVSPGKAYIQGYENEIISPRELIVDKARSVDHLKTSSIAISPSYGQYLYVTNIVNLPDFGLRNQLTFYNASSGGSIIGTATGIAIDYVEPNTTDSNAIYKLFVTDVAMTGGNTVSNIGRAIFAGGQVTILAKTSVITSNTTDFILGELVTASTRTATVHKHTRSTGELYVFKHSASATPVIGDNITAPSGAAARITGIEILGKNIVDNLLVDTGTLTTYSVTNESNVVDMSYKLYYDTTVTCVAGAGSFSVTGMTIDPKEQGNFIIASAAGIHPLSTATVAGNGLSVSFAGISPAGATIRIICAATKIGTDAAPKTKTVATATVSGVTPASVITLAKADGIRLTSVTSTIDGLITDRYIFDSGASDYAYLQSYITLVGTAPGGTLTIVYEYFNHNAGSGDYFSVDSYTASGLADYFSSPILKYKSKNTGNTYDLRNVLDFRPRVGEDGTYTGIGASFSRLVQSDSRITTSIQNYVGRTDAIVYDKDGVLRVITGIPDKNPKLPTITQQSLHLYTIDVPAYTYSITDVRATKEKNRVFTMKDVGKLETRVANIEEYVTLSETETSTVNYDIIDATTGLSRYKSGFLVDTFNNPDVISDINNPLFQVAYVSETIVPIFEVIESGLNITANLCQTTGSVVTLPYTESVLAKQPLSSKITNVNPFSVFSWVGTMRLTPASDTWADINNLPTITNSTSETINIQRPWNWVAPAGVLVSRTPSPTPVG